MKTLKFKYVLIFCSFLILNSCDWINKSDKPKEKPQETVPETIDKKIPEERLKEIETFFENYDNITVEANYVFCDAEESLLGDSKYDTEYGFAYFSIPIPKGTKLVYQNRNLDASTHTTTINYKCKPGVSDEFTEDYYLVPRFLSKLHIAPYKGAKLIINVDYTSLKGECNPIEGYDILIEKKKTSTVGGLPLTDTLKK